MQLPTVHINLPCFVMLAFPVAGIEGIQSPPDRLKCQKNWTAVGLIRYLCCRRGTPTTGLTDWAPEGEVQFGLWSVSRRL